VVELGGADFHVTFGPIAPNWSPAGGAPGGHIFTTDPFGNEFYFHAPPAYLGDKSAFYGGSLSWWIRNEPGGPLNIPDVVLHGAGLVLLNSAPANATSVWGSRMVSLAASSDWHVGTAAGPAPTAAQFMAVLAALDRLNIRGEFLSGAETGYLDTVAMVPEPAAAFLALILGVMLIRRR
jgi:alkaline phosphatase D